MQSRKDMVNLWDAVDKGANKNVNKRILCEKIVLPAGEGKKGYRIDMADPCAFELQRKLNVKFKEDKDVGMPELIYIGTHCAGNTDLYNRA